MPHNVHKTAPFKSFTDLPAATQKTFSPSAAARWNLLAVRSEQQAFVKSVNTKAAGAKTPAKSAKATKPAARVSTAKTRTPRPIPNDKKRTKLGSKERSLLG